MNTTTVINIIVVFLITVVFGYLLGIAVTNTVDQRLSDISINLPKITLPRQNIYVNLNDKNKADQLVVNNTFHSKLSDDGPNYNLSSPDAKLKPLKLNSYNDKNIYEGFNSESDADIQVVTSEEIPPGIYNKDFVAPQNPTQINRGGQVDSNQLGIIKNPIGTGNRAIDQITDQLADNSKCVSNNCENKPIVGCKSDADCNVVYGNGQNKCLSNNKCYCVKGSGLFCHYGPTYYKDTKDMTDRQLQKFKLKAKFDKMTVQDYVNWLMLFEDEPDQLAPRHLNNLFKILKGIKITLNDIPRDRIPPPMTAQDYFTQLYTLDDQINIYAPQVSDTAGLQIPANYSNYSQFQAPQNLKHLSVRPLTLDEELVKADNQVVLEATQPQPSNIWDTATGNDNEARILGKQPLMRANLKAVNKVRSQISGNWTDPTN